MSPRTRIVEAPADQWQFDDFVEDQGWSDGLPCIPPTRERVDDMLGGRDAGELLGTIPPSGAAVSRGLVAVNAVMAGCRPAMLPVVETTIRAILDPSFNLLGVQTTTHPAAPIAVVNGPARAAASLNSGAGCFGPGRRGNAVVGRAVRLCLLNIGGARPGLLDMATMGQPGKYTLVIAEHEEASPWSPLCREFRDATEAGAVTVFATEGPHNAGDHESREPANLMHTIAGVLAEPGSNVWYHDAQVLVLLCPEHAGIFHGAGMSRNDVAELFCEHATMPSSRLSVEVLDRRVRLLHPDLKEGTSEAPLRAVTGPDRVLIAVAGGAGRHSMVCPPFGNSRAVCLPVSG
jgi:hypothetical protein